MIATVHALPIQSKPVIIELLGEPRGKGRPRFVRATGRTYTDALTAAYDHNLRLQAAVVMRGRAILEGALAVRVEAYMPVPGSWSGRKKGQALNGLIRPTTKPDSDNIIKQLDALNTIVWHDDKQIVELSLAKFYSATPRLCIEVRQL